MVNKITKLFCIDDYKAFDIGDYCVEIQIFFAMYCYYNAALISEVLDNRQ